MGVLLCEVTQINLKLSIKMTIDLANILDRNCDSLFQAFRWWRVVRRAMKSRGGLGTLAFIFSSSFLLRTAPLYPNGTD